MWGTGSHIGHTAVFLDTKDGPYIYESTGSNPFGKNYWPPPYGFIRTPYQTWFKYAKNASYDVTIIKIKQKYSTMVTKNMDTIYKWWELNKGTSYGYQNFLWGWIDTPNQNFPEKLSSDLLIMTISFLFRNNILEKHLNKFIVEPLNQRLGYYFKENQNYNWTGILNWSYKNNYPIFNLWTLPELDEWKYNGKYSRVCDSFVLTIFKLVGIIPDDIQVSEFSPRDLYLVELWEQWSNVMDDYPVLGENKIFLPNFNSISLYSHMNEKCPTIPIEYYRPSNC